MFNSESDQFKPIIGAKLIQQEAEQLAAQQAAEDTPTEAEDTTGEATAPLTPSQENHQVEPGPTEAHPGSGN